MRVIALWLISLRCFAVVSASTAWEVRTGGDDNNGGGYDSTIAGGTDYSQQAAAQFSYTDLVVATTSATSAAFPFTVAAAGNVIHILSGTGCTTGFYQVLSVSGITATLDRTAGTGTCTARLGGAVQTWYGAAQGIQSNSNTIWIRAGTYVQTSLPGHFNGCCVTTIVGYSATRGDLSATTAYSSNPLITTATNSVGLVQTCGSYYVFSNVNFTNTAGMPSTGIDNTNGGCNGGSITVYHCQFSGFTRALYATLGAGATAITAIASDFGTATIADIDNQTNFPIYLYGNYFHPGAGAISVNSAAGAQVTALTAENNVFSGGLNHFNVRFVFVSLINNAFYNASSDCVYLGNTTTTLMLANNIFYGCGGYGLNYANAAPSGQQLAGNFANGYGSNTSGARNNLAAGIGDITLTASPWVNTATPNFALNATAGGGVLLKGVGFPGGVAFGTGYVDVGAIQSQAAAAAVTTAYPIF